MCSCKFRFWVFYYKSLFDCWENEGISCKIKSLCVNLGSVLFGGAMGEETRINKIFPFLLSSFSFWGIKCCREWCWLKALFIYLFSSNFSFKETVLESSIFHGRLIWMIILNSWIKQWINQILIDSCGGKFQWFFFFSI